MGKEVGTHYLLSDILPVFKQNRGGWWGLVLVVGSFPEEVVWSQAGGRVENKSPKIGLCGM